MNQRTPKRGPRPQQNLNTKAQHWWPHRRHWPVYPGWPDYYDYYDYNDDYDYYQPGLDDLSVNSTGVPNPVPNPKPKSAQYTENHLMCYQQGFRDGWSAAMDYILSGLTPISPEPPVPPMTPVEPAPMEGEVK